ncbi:MAG TPA: TlpA disulfide reductase family protein [Agriterribacter sp.]|nr:TlpA disulfide reductase family protein [Agriterribacter sp.]
MKLFTSLIYIFTTLLILTTACRQKEQIANINIVIQNNPKKRLVSLINKAYGESPIILDTASIDAGNSSCHFQVVGKSQGIYSVKFENDSSNGRYILFCSDQPVIDINTDWNDFAAYSTSSPASASLKKLLVTFNQYLREIDTLNRNSMQSETDSVRNIWKQAEHQKRQESLEYLLHYTDSAKNPTVALYALGILEQRQTDSSLMKPLLASLASRFSDNEDVKKINADYADFLSKEAATLRVGKLAPSFSLPDTAGQVVSLQSFKGRYTLVDFWASWCAPCRKENPSIVAAFNAYKEKNFSVLGVSLDKDKKAWLNAIHSDHLTWQHVSDLKEWDSMVVPLYDIEGIPFNVLLDPGGKIIAMNLRGDALKQKLAEVLQ